MKKIEGEEAKKLNRDWLRFARKQRDFQSFVTPDRIRSLKKVAMTDDWSDLIGCVGGVTAMIRGAEEMTLKLVEIREAYLNAVGETPYGYAKFLANMGMNERGIITQKAR